jgi:hypothetical protein
MTNFNILIATQNCITILDRLDKKFKPIIVGSEKIETPPTPRYLKDSTGDNLSEKNPLYCEMTALYWLWKNKSVSGIVGLNHYRRFFNISTKSFLKHYFIPVPKITDRILEKINFTNQECLKILDSKDIILPNPHKLNKTLYEEYINDKHCIKSDIDQLIEILLKRGESALDIDDIFQGKRLYHYNMFITKRKTFDSYADWVFPILKELENSISLEGRTVQQKRVLGYLSERLLTYYFLSRNLSIYHSDVIWVNQNYKLFKYLKPTNITACNILNIIGLRLYN